MVMRPLAPLAVLCAKSFSMAKRDMRAGERLDGIGGFCAYGLTENSDTARSINALPLSLSEDCVLRRDLRKDDVITFTDVTLPDRGVVDELWNEQLALWPVAERASAK